MDIYINRKDDTRVQAEYEADKDKYKILHADGQIRYLNYDIFNSRYGRAMICPNYKDCEYALQKDCGHSKPHICDYTDECISCQQKCIGKDGCIPYTEKEQTQKLDPPPRFDKVFEEGYAKMCEEEKPFKPNAYDNNGDAIQYPISGGSMEQPSLPTIVCLCGSTRFKEQFFDVAKSLTCDGIIVLAPFHFRKCGDVITPELEDILSALHFRKIDLADEVMVLNVGGYIGESTRKEIEYAKSNNKIIKYLEEVE